VLQEILHRYVAIGRRHAIQAAFDALPGVVDEVLPVTDRDAQRAKDLAPGSPDLSARDVIHMAIMAHQGVRRIMSFDRRFDGVPGMERLGG
jgi:hypothetical protein